MCYLRKRQAKTVVTESRRVGVNSDQFRIDEQEGFALHSVGLAGDQLT